MYEHMKRAVIETLRTYTSPQIETAIYRIGGSASVDPERACFRVWLLEIYQERHGEAATNNVMKAIGWE